jgi:hypothetical protein
MNHVPAQDEDVAEVIVEESWLAKRRAMEVAVRAVNWVWAAALFAEAPEFSAPLRKRFLKALLQHGNHILDNLEYADNNGNHYLSNGVGLLFLGVLLADFAAAASWRKKGYEIVWGESTQQVHDGADFEQARYQGLVAEFWYACVLSRPQRYFGAARRCATGWPHVRVHAGGDPSRTGLSANRRQRRWAATISTTSGWLIPPASRSRRRAVQAG